MVELRRTTPDDPGFLTLIRRLDAELLARNGAEQAQLNPLNSLECIHHALVAEESGHPLGCGALKFHGSATAELKRMFVHPEARRRGIAAALVQALETWAREEGAREVILETGVRHAEALALYKALGFQRITNYGPYAGKSGSICLGKALSPGPQAPSPG
nr:GNAT family N-acetyltransferase [uncultured Holophaga sp.]